MDCFICGIPIGDEPLIRLDSEAVTAGFCSSSCRDTWEKQQEEWASWPIEGDE